MKEPDTSEVILFAMVGLSPAILTETVWALAHEEIPVIPDRVVVVTTKAGRARLQEELFTQDGQGMTIWKSLRAVLESEGYEIGDKLVFGMAGDSVRLCSAIDPESRITMDLEDIRTARENEAMANFILESLRGFVETPGTEVIASMAGGRKTMGALLYAAMTLVGREFDQVTHVFVSEPYESPALTPRFYFPGQPEQALTHANGNVCQACKAVVELAYVPFVPLRNAFATELGQMPESFTQLVRKYRRDVSGSRVKYHVRVHISSPLLEINGERYRLSPKEHVLMHFLAKRLLEGAAPLERYSAAYEGLIRVSEELFQRRPHGNLDDWRHEVRFPANFAAEDIRKLVNQLRSKLRKYGPIPRSFAELLPKKGNFGLELEPERISFLC
jgi:CRISPR-associated protein (TIGR02584 family)